MTHCALPQAGMCVHFAFVPGDSLIDVFLPSDTRVQEFLPGVFNLYFTPETQNGGPDK